MNFVIGLIIGLAIGAAIAYFLTSKKMTAQSAALQDLQRQLALAESEHERRLREVTARLRQDSAPSPPPAARPAPAATVPTAPLPPPTATAPLPVAPPPAPPPAPSHPTPSATIAALTASAVSDPSALLAASYSPQASVRRDVAAAIAQCLPTANPGEQARWLPVLGRLTRDADASVRLPAVAALAHVRSPRRLDLLRRALRDPDPAVVQVAQTLMGGLKGRSLPPKATPRPRLPKNR
ncbi:MAG TPA: YtxH domain-containing protein [Candidatus Obscuribacterales bacterium]